MSPQDRGRTDRSIWLVLAFAEPPKGWGFTRSTSGKCWWRRIEGREWAVNLGRKLAEMNIHGVCKRVRDDKARRSDRNGLTPIGAAATAAMPSVEDIEFQAYKEDFSTNARQHRKAAALPEPVNQPTPKYIATSRHQQVLMHGSTVNGARKL